MDRHTPGPWHAAKSADGEHYNVRRSPGDHLNLAIVKPLLPSEGGAEATEANARLISAAPELLEAAEALIEADQQWKEMDARQALRTAIAKAKGRE